MTILSAAQWPLLQSLNEVKHKSGLFTCTATFISPIGESAMPTEIETSIGPVDVWPDPVVQTGTDGMQTITATGYGSWDESISEVTYALSVGRVLVYWDTDGIEGTGAQAALPVIFESVHVRKMGNSIPPLPTQAVADPTVPNSSSTTLRILDLTGADITNKEFSTREFTPYGAEKKARISKLVRPTMVKKNTFGTVVETEATYEYVTGLADTALIGGTIQFVGTYLWFGFIDAAT